MPDVFLVIGLMFLGDWVGVWRFDGGGREWFGERGKGGW